MYHELSKSEKKVARIAIDKGLEATFGEGIERFEALINNWRAGKYPTNKEAYHTLFKSINETDNAIANRFDGLTGGRYLVTVAEIFKDGYITEEDIREFREETKKIIKKCGND